MATAFVILVSLLVGAATYVATVRNARRTPAAIGFEGSHATLAADAVPDTDDLVAEPGDGDTRSGAEVVELDRVRIPVPPAGDADEATRGESEVGVEDAAAIAGGDEDPSAVTGATREVDEPTEAPDPEAEVRATTPLAPVIVRAAEVPAPEPGMAYLRVSTEGPGWRDRVAGIVGIAILLVVGAAAIAFGLYRLGTAINAVVQRFLEG